MDEHSHSLQSDLTVIHNRLLARRRMLGWMSAVGMSSVSGMAFAQGPVGGMGGTGGTPGTLPNAPTGAGGTTGCTPVGGTTGDGTVSVGGASGGTADVFSANGACIADPAETNGPYPSDGSNSANGALSNILTTKGVLRSDIRPSFGGSGNAAPGVPFWLTLNLVNVNKNCAPLAGYAIYIWHCDRDGKYSLYDLPNEDFLRGVQVTDANGRVTFTTIIPGCYMGRYPHIHFEVYPSIAAATNYRNAVLTSQLALPGDVSAAVYSAASGYSSSAVAFTRITLAGDNVFGNNSAAQIEAQTMKVTSTALGYYVGGANIGLVV